MQPGDSCPLLTPYGEPCGKEVRHWGKCYSKAALAAAQRQRRFSPTRAEVGVPLRGAPTKNDVRRMLLEHQGGKCAVCKSPLLLADAHLDHDHRCCPGTIRTECLLEMRCVRGMLCQGCNFGLGWFRDNPEALQRGADYLRRSARRLALAA